MSKPFPGASWKGGAAYMENEHLTMLLNQLALDGLKPVFTNVITERGQGVAAQDRLVFICEK